MLADHAPVGAQALQPQHGRTLEELAAQVLHRAGQTTGVAHGVEGAGAAVEQRASDSVGAGGFAAGGAGQQFDRRTTALPLLAAAGEVGLATGVVGHVQGAFATQLAIDVVAIDQGEHQRWRGAQGLVEPLAGLVAEAGLDVVRRYPHAGIDQPDIAPGPAVAGGMGFEQAHALAGFQQVEGGGEAGETGPYHAHIHFDLAAQHGAFRQFGRQILPEAFLAQGHGSQSLGPEPAQSKVMPWASGSSWE
ncbi:hypothetical protein D3C76_1042990 [compost metagenome]